MDYLVQQDLQKSKKQVADAAKKLFKVLDQIAAHYRRKIEVGNFAAHANKIITSVGVLESSIVAGEASNLREIVKFVY